MRERFGIVVYWEINSSVAVHPSDWKPGGEFDMVPEQPAADQGCVVADIYVYGDQVLSRLTKKDCNATDIFSYICEKTDPAYTGSTD